MNFQRSCPLFLSCLVSPTLLMSLGPTSPASAPVGFCLPSALTVTTLFLSLGLLSLASPLNGTTPPRTSWISTSEPFFGPTTQPAPSNLVTLSDYPCMTLALFVTKRKPRNIIPVATAPRNQNHTAAVSARTQSHIRRLVAYIIFTNNIFLLNQPDPASLYPDRPFPDSCLPASAALFNNKLVKLLCVFGYHSEFKNPFLTENLANMNSDPNTEWRSSIEGALKDLGQCINNLNAKIDNMSVSSITTAPSAGARAEPPKTLSVQPPCMEPRLCPPERFEGNIDQGRAFLTQCEIQFELQPSSFPSERSKVAYIISLLTGKAKLWGTAEWQRDAVICHRYKDFARELLRVFCPRLPHREASRGLLSIKQGNRRVTEYIIDFHTLSVDSWWNDEALQDAFMQGLSDEIKDELATRDPPESLKDLEDLATRIDLRLFERKQSR
ncbi:uncharacterized protein LOC106512393 [Austrofundulus limnaeus]|uniref:Uncharacterized protein LOC106512393 n=1 Tax=Austrofundulus limnaeus TaxID=52670 RepID=A0A2I4ALU2_AUSLI|nr:PREDICTED: uncharacterized protein LOC106512393 [Austrofundulus limnaeus]